jgi:S-formylglutathione hydrolase FrmB
MALLHVRFHSDILGASSMYVVLPQRVSLRRQADQSALSRKFPTLFLLHGLSDDESIWMRRTSIERYADQYGIAVVMPNAHRSFYTNMRYGYAYGTFFAEELPAIARSMFPLSEAREDTFVAGLSMGGYGAFKLALSHPESYAAAASLSGALDASALNLPTEYNLIFGERKAVKGSENDLFMLAERLVQSGQPRPRLFQCCGTEDFLYEDNLRFKRHAERIGLEIDYEEEPGAHEWSYWDFKIQRVLEWLPIRSG